MWIFSLRYEIYTLGLGYEVVNLFNYIPENIEYKNSQLYGDISL